MFGFLSMEIGFYKGSWVSEAPAIFMGKYQVPSLHHKPGHLHRYLQLWIEGYTLGKLNYFFPRFSYNREIKQILISITFCQFIY